MRIAIYIRVVRAALRNVMPEGEALAVGSFTASRLEKGIDLFPFSSP